VGTDARGKFERRLNCCNVHVGSQANHLDIENLKPGGTDASRHLSL
jgi:hypothetical protein